MFSIRRALRAAVVVSSLQIAGCDPVAGSTEDLSDSLQAAKRTSSATLAAGPEVIWAGGRLALSGCGYQAGYNKQNDMTLTMQLTGPAGTSSVPVSASQGCVTAVTTAGAAGDYKAVASGTTSTGKTAVLASVSFAVVAPPASSCKLQAATKAAHPLSIRDAAVVSVGGLLYNFGGIVNDSYYTNTAYKYDPALDTWTQIASMPTNVEIPGAATDGKLIYLIGPPAKLQGGVMYRYDPSTDRYETLAGLDPTNDNFAGGVAYLSGKVYYVGGTPADWFVTGTSQLLIYDVASNTWSSGAPLPGWGDGTMTAMLSITVSNGALIVAGGLGLFGGETSHKTFRYDPASNAWTDSTVADAPYGIASQGSGQVSGQWLMTAGSSAIAYDFAANQWALAGSLPTGWTSSGASSGAGVGSILYVIGAAGAATLALSCQ